MVKRGIKFGLIGIAVVLIAIQAIPYGRASTNPPVVAEPDWDVATTRDRAVRACFDCHSNETYWPWYSKIAPVSWWTQNHVDEGRDELNFSEWSSNYDELDEIAESVIEGEMPPLHYTLLPGSKRLSHAEREQLVRGLISTFGGSERYRSGSDGVGEDDDD